MSDVEKLIQSLREVIAAAADKAPLQKHLADLLLQTGQFAEAEKIYRDLLVANPEDASLKFALAETFYRQEKMMMALVVLEELIKSSRATGEAFLLAARVCQNIGQTAQAQVFYRQALEQNPALADAALAAQLNVTEVPLPAAPAAPALSPEPDDIERIAVEDWPTRTESELERSKTTFADVGGMENLKEDIRMKIIHPLRNRELYKMYGKNIGGGMLMYGPPGCGKTYLARATAGEVQAYFLSIGIHDVLNMYLGQSEGNLHGLFELARRNKPCVMFIDEVDALGASRTDMRQSAGRHLINQLLAEMDGLEADNDGILILAASNAPWHIDSALRRPGRFDQVLFVPPPDTSARAAILQVMLKEKPVEAIDYELLARETDGFSGADLKGMIDRAIEEKLREAMKKGVPVPLKTVDLQRAARLVKPTTKEWFATARNYALYSNEGGTYDDVLAYLKINNNNKDGNMFSKFLFGSDDR